MFGYYLIFADKIIGVVENEGALINCKKERNKN
jgi:hypothetical protein